MKLKDIQWQWGTYNAIRDIQQQWETYNDNVSYIVDSRVATTGFLYQSCHGPITDIYVQVQVQIFYLAKSQFITI